MGKTYDVAIVGSGPAALTAAIYTARENLSTVVIEKSVVGGLMATISKIDNYPGIPDVPGGELAGKFWDQAEKFGAEMKFAEVLKVNCIDSRNKSGNDSHDAKCCKNDNVVKITTDDGNIVSKTLIIATGNSYRKPGIPGDDFAHYCATCDGPFYKGKSLIVIGGGNSAVQEAIFLSGLAKKVEILVRNKLSASQILQDDLKKYSNKISVRLGAVPEEIVVENGGAVGVKLEGGEVVKADGVFAFVGSVPSSAWLSGSGVELDKFGFVKTDSKMATATAGIFAAGDIRADNVKQIATAVGDGAIAARSVREYLGKEGR